MSAQRTLGLDLGSAAFKLALVERADVAPRLIQVRWLELAPGADPAARRAALETLLRGIRLADVAQTVSVVDDPRACVRPVLVPRMPAGELPGAVTWALQQYLAVPPDTVTVGWQPLGDVDSAGAKQLKLLAAAIPTVAIREHLALLAQAGLMPTQLLPRAAAVITWFRQIRPTEPRPIALLEMGATSSEFLVVRGGHLLFVRKIPVSGHDITQAMTAVLMTAHGQAGLTAAEAESVKRRVGIPPAETAEGVAQGISGVQLRSLIRGSLERLSVEVGRSLAFSGESLGGAVISELIVVGGGAHLRGLAEWLTEQLGILVTVPDPVGGIAQPPGVFDQAATAPLSLVPALGAALGAGVGVNVLPPEVKDAARVRAYRAALTGVVTAVTLGAALLRLGLGIYQQSLATQVAALRVEQAAVAPQVTAWKLAIATQEKLAQEPRWEEVFKDLSRLVPRQIHLTALVIDERAVILRGMARALDRTADVVLSEFMLALGEGLLTDVSLGSSRQLEQSPVTVEFEIRCRLR